MNLLSDQDWLDFRGALVDVADTFHLCPVQILFRTEIRLTAFNESRASNKAITAIDLLCLNVERSSFDAGAKAMMKQEGFMDNAEGYILLHYLTAKNAVPSLIDANGASALRENRDTIMLLGLERDIMGVNLVGPTQTDYQLVKIHYKKILGK